MKSMCIYPGGGTPACRLTCQILEAAGAEICSHPSPEITHLLLDTPSFDSEGKLRSGDEVGPILQRLPENLTVVGGRLNHPALAAYRKIDLLEDEGYLAKNAAITAHCALGIAAQKLGLTFQDSQVLILGWGRIGKSLARQFRALGGNTWVAARKEKDRWMLSALGYQALDFPQAQEQLGQMDLVVNTVPHPVLDCTEFSGLAMDLASARGLLGENVLWARGLPGIHAPQSCARIMAQRILQICEEERL